MRQRATILDIIEAGLWGKSEQVRAYTELLIQRIQAEQDTPQAEQERDVTALRRLIECRDTGERGRVISPAVAPDHVETSEDGDEAYPEQLPVPQFEQSGDYSEFPSPLPDRYVKQEVVNKGLTLPDVEVS